MPTTSTCFLAASGSTGWCEDDRRSHSDLTTYAAQREGSRLGRQHPLSASPAVEERRIAVGGLSTHYLTAGHGAPILLLHGDGESAMDWCRAIPAFARSHRVLAPSLPGHGSSARWDGDHSPEFFAEFVRDFLAAVGAAEGITVVGNSLGGAIAVRYALEHSDRVRALILVDSLGLGREINRLPALQVIPGLGELSVALSRTRRGAGAYARMRAHFAFADARRAPSDWLAEQRRLARVRGVLDTSLAAKRKVIGVRGQKALVLDALPRLTMPALVLWGEGDRLLPPAHAYAATERLPRGTHNVIAGAGHLPQLEQPERFVDAVVSFLSETTPR